MFRHRDPQNSPPPQKKKRGNGTSGNLGPGTYYCQPPPLRRRKIRREHKQNKNKKGTTQNTKKRRRRRKPGEKKNKKNKRASRLVRASHWPRRLSPKHTRRPLTSTAQLWRWPQARPTTGRSKAGARHWPQPLPPKPGRKTRRGPWRSPWRSPWSLKGDNKCLRKTPCKPCKRLKEDKRRKMRKGARLSPCKRLKRRQPPKERFEKGCISLGSRFGVRGVQTGQKSPQITSSFDLWGEWKRPPNQLKSYKTKGMEPPQPKQYGLAKNWLFLVAGQK